MIRGPDEAKEIQPMQVEIEFYDEFGKDIVFPTWWGLEESEIGMPPRSKLKANRHIYSHSFLAVLGHSLSLSDTIANVKRVMELVTPTLNKGLAVGYYIQSFTFGGILLDDKKTMNDYQIKVNTTKATFTGNTMESIKAVLGIEVNVHPLTGPLITVRFEKFDRENTTCHDVMDRVHKASGIPYDNLRLIREYPTMRAVKFIPSERLLGYKGKYERGICVVSPHKGPIFPATVPTPPQMKLSVAETHHYDLLAAEDEWWGRFRTQPLWEGEIESLSGMPDQVQLRLEAPRPPVCHASGGVSATVVHEQITKPVYLKNASQKDMVVAEPDTSPIRGPCSFIPSVIAQEVEYGPMHLPSPAMISRSGIDYAKYEPGLVYGQATIILPWKEVEAKYRLKIGFPSNKLTVCAVERGVSKESEEIYLHFEGDLAKGISDTFYFRGSYCVRTPLEVIPDSLRRPFCVFQLTPGGSVPEVVSSAMGQRYSGLKHKSYTMLSEGLKLDSTGDSLEWLTFAQFTALLPRQWAPRVIVTDILFETPETGAVFYKSVCIIWCLQANADNTFSPTFPILKLGNGRILVRTSTVFDLTFALEKEGKPIGIGVPPDDILERMDADTKAKLPRRGANHNAIQAIREGKGVVHVPMPKAKVETKAAAPLQTRYAQQNAIVRNGPTQSSTAHVKFEMKMDFHADEAPAGPEVDAFDLLSAIYKRQDDPDPVPSAKSRNASTRDADNRVSILTERQMGGKMGEWPSGDIIPEDDEDAPLTKKQIKESAKKAKESSKKAKESTKMAKESTKKSQPPPQPQPTAPVQKATSAAQPLPTKVSSSSIDLESMIREHASSIQHAESRNSIQADLALLDSMMPADQKKRKGKGKGNNSALQDLLDDDDDKKKKGCVVS